MNKRAYTVCFDLFIPSLASFTLTRIPKMKNLITVVCATAIIALAGCSSSSTPPPREDTPSPPQPSAQIQVVHAVADAPSITVNVGGPPPAGSDLIGLVFAGVSNGSFLPVDAVDVSVDANLPDGTAVEVVAATPVDFVVDTRTIIVATGAVGAIEAVVLVQDVPGAASTGNARLRFMHAAVGVGTVDVYATAPDADLAASAPVATIAFQEAGDVLDLAPGDYQVRVTPTGDPATVIFDAGTATLIGGEDILAVAVNNTTASTQPITLLVADTTTGDSDVVQDVNGEAATRFVHASPDAGPFDILVDDVAEVEGIVYTEFAETEGRAPATYDIEVTAAGDALTSVFQVDITLSSGGYYESTALGSVLAVPVEPAAAEEFTVGLTAFGFHDYRRIVTDTKLRIVHASVLAAAGADIYVVEAGTDITGATATAAGAVIGDSTGFITLDPGSYDIVITVVDEVTEEDVEVFRMDAVALDADGIYSAIAVDDLVNVGELSIIALDDLAP